MKNLFLIVLLLAAPALAQETPARHPSAQIEQDKKDAESRKAQLEQEAKTIGKEMENTQESLVDIAAKIKTNEAKLSALEKKMGENRKEQDAIEARLKKDKGSIGELVLALERLERTPPEAILARPGAPLETAQSAMLLQSILPNIYGRAESLKKDLARLDELLQQLDKDKAEAACKYLKKNDVECVTIKN